MAGIVPLVNDNVFKAGGNSPATLIPPMPQWTDVIYLGAGSTAESYTIPAGAVYLNFSANNDFYANGLTTATVPAADNTSGTGSELNPTSREVSGLTTISLIAPNANTIITISVYK